MDNGVVVDMGNSIEGFVRLSSTAASVNSPADMVQETTKLDRVWLRSIRFTGGSCSASRTFPGISRRGQKRGRDHSDGVEARHGYPPVDMSAISE